MLLFACKNKDGWLESLPVRYWRPLLNYHTPRFTLPSRTNLDNPVLLDSARTWSRRLNLIIRPIQNLIIDKQLNNQTNLPTSVDYIDCKALLAFFETAQIFEMEVKPGLITKEIPLDMAKFRSLNRAIIKLRRNMEAAGLI